ncbi:MAG: Obg family GTPase CgtA [Gammaproteobacteria bacterium]|jgi:GTPase|nr:Obg family GTPase CgtA [Gammaproteobacteria bacterium]MBT4462429.1 Obg family GTPase CgtA [Gammaproteobacteria bacterium]MBT4655356.1 Obg family GTPase CgtA [Gammaproteobacteria bacterium]MBT5117282.1 Obg family GTPase CgtA [Gammaproteobacteria bacterium]MBT5762171.1 Obg family GTPase CgtA [Gammaproteobacteria bacterium]
MKFIDETIILVKAGNGGNGCLSFRREKYIPFGGPDGGDGGHGGSIIIQAKDGLNTLADFRNRSKFIAPNGKTGGGRNKKGRGGDDLVIQLPAGSVIYDLETQELICDLERDGQSITIASGGDYGLGNARFKTSTNRAPRKTTDGTPGEERQLKIVLKVLADVGLVGLPNVGKSSILAAISMAKPKIANYAFTTIHPNLGVVLISDYEKFVVADLPGLIVGASTGAGLGIQFLKHISRTKLLLNVIDISKNNIDEALKDVDVIAKELKDYDAGLGKKDRWYVFNKIDMLNKKELEILKKSVNNKIGKNVFFVSAKEKSGLDDVCEKIIEYLRDL